MAVELCRWRIACVKWTVLDGGVENCCGIIGRGCCVCS